MTVLLPHFAALLRQACLDTIAALPERLPGKQFYGFIINPAEDFSDMAAALSTHEDIEKRQLTLPADHELSPDLLEALKAHPDLLAQTEGARSRRETADVDIAEWEYLGIFPDTFQPLNDALRDFYDENEDEDVDWEARAAMMEGTFIKVITELKRDQVFMPPVFVDDVFLGVQFSDGQTPMVERISAKVNSTRWHNRLKISCA